MPIAYSKVDAHSQMHRPMLRALKHKSPWLINWLIKSDASPDVEGIETCCLDCFHFCASLSDASPDVEGIETNRP